MIAIPLPRIGSRILKKDCRAILVSFYDGNFRKAIGSIGGAKTNGLIKYDGDYIIRRK